jgi:hypothetical protein
VLCPHFAGQRYFARTRADCRNKQGGTFSPFWLETGRPSLDLPNGNEYEALLRGTVPLPDYCHTTHRVTRWQNYERITVSRVVRCDPPDTRKNTTKHDVVNPWDEGWKG